MNEPKTSPDQAPGHYGAAYGEQVPADAIPRSAPKTDADRAETATSAVAIGTESVSPVETTTVGDDGAPVVFTPDDVHARPPDHTPTENAPESEKAGLIFERS